MNAIDWSEYDSAALWCARRKIKGDLGDPLPPLLSTAVLEEINEHPDEFKDRVRLTAYAIAMNNNA